jgi:hypothetical protein
LLIKIILNQQRKFLVFPLETRRKINNHITHARRQLNRVPFCTKNNRQWHNPNAPR